MDWTVSDGLVRLYGGDVSWRLQPSPADVEHLRALLSRSFGPPRELHARGSRRAQRLAAGVIFLGIAVLVVGFRYDIVPLGPIGMLCIIGGWGTHDFFKMKIAAPKTTAG